MEKNYYAQTLNANKLFNVYQTAIPRVHQYLESEVAFIRQQLKGHENVLELGAGYGRIVRELADKTVSIVGIDISADSVRFGAEYLKDIPNVRLITMDANALELEEKYDAVLCLQNGLSAMKNRGQHIIDQALSVLKNGGKAYFSTYSPKFWEYRLAWFKEQAEKGLLGEIDREKTKDGNIVCKDGFIATTYSVEQLEQLGRASKHPYTVDEVDESSIFLTITKS